MPDDGRTVAWLAYVPLPGFALLAVLLRPRDRLVRFHAWQATLAIVGLILLLVLVGLLARVSEAGGWRTFVGAIAGLLLLGGLAQLGYGLAMAALGRFARIRPWWDVAAVLKR